MKRNVASAFAFCVILGVVSATAADNAAKPSPRRTDAWYRDCLVNVHFDNHSGLLGKDLPRDKLAAMLAGLPVSMLQVSAQSNAYATYPTDVGLRNPAAGGYDTLATFKNITARQGKKLCIYMSNDRRPVQLKLHPEWGGRDAQGKQANWGEPSVCMRPHHDKKGYLYEQFLPQIREIIQRYDPEGFWFDGDLGVIRPCWCPGCLKDWKDDTGLDDAPRKPSDPKWKEWIAWNHKRFREYRRQLAEAIHEASPKALYTSNWSWTWTPEPVPDYADTLSCDAWSILHVHSIVQRWGAQKTPFDIMSYCTPDARAFNHHDTTHSYSFQRTLQEGALTMSEGGRWFVWSFNGDQVPADGIAVTKICAQYFLDRKPALGPSESLSQVAVLDSETSWQAEGEPVPQNGGAVHAIARNLAEAHYFTDVVNEATYRDAAARYSVVVVPDHREVAPETLAALRQLVERGGTLVLCGAALRGQGDEPPEVAALLGLERTPPAKDACAHFSLGHASWHLMNAWSVTPKDAKTLVKAGDGRPMLCSHRVGKGTVIYLAATNPQHPDGHLMNASLRAAGLGPSYKIDGGGRAAAILCTLRKKPGQTVLHVVDLTTYVGGKLADVDATSYTDLNSPLTNLTVTLPMPAEPKRIQAVPAGTIVKSHFENGRLTLTIRQMQSHAAVILDGEVNEPLPLLGPDTRSTGHVFHIAPPIGRLFADSFEDARLGPMPPHNAPADAWKAESRGDAKIVVTNEAASDGRQSLKFIDAPGSSFYPFLHRSFTPFQEGNGVLSFDVRLPAGMPFVAELRNEGRGTGPSISVDAAGNLKAAGRQLTTLAPDVWHHVTIEFPMNGRTPTFDVTVASPDSERKHFADLRYACPLFFECNSVYFIAPGQKAGCFYLDNVVMERRP